MMSKRSCNGRYQQSFLIDVVISLMIVLGAVLLDVLAERQNWKDTWVVYWNIVSGQISALKTNPILTSIGMSNS